MHRARTGAEGPDVVIAGAQKSGTTTLHAWLREHPDVFTAAPKELHYFDLHHARGPGWYAEQFAGAAAHQLRLEATPSYMYLPEATERMARELPDASVVLILRDPVSRAYSHYQHNVSRGLEDLGFDEALDAEPTRLGRISDRLHYSYLDRGRYLQQVERVLALYPSEQVKILLFERLRDDPAATWGDLAGFLGLPADSVTPTVGTQSNRYKSRHLRRLRRMVPRRVRLGGAVSLLDRVPQRGYRPMSEAARSRLTAEFAAERAPLATLLGEDLGQWR